MFGSKSFMLSFAVALFSSFAAGQAPQGGDAGGGGGGGGGMATSRRPTVSPSPTLNPSQLSVLSLSSASLASVASLSSASFASASASFVSVASVSSASVAAASASASAAAAAEKQAKDGPALVLDTKVDAVFGVLGALLILSGAPMGFWGGRNRWSSYFLTGAYAGALVVSVFIFRWGIEEQNPNPNGVIRGMYLLACIVAGMVVGGVGVIFWKGTRYIVGAGGGFVLSFFILSLHTNVLIRPIGLRYILVVGLSAVGFVLATVPKLAIYVTCAATAAMGAAAVVLGIDCFTTGGLKEYWVYILGFDGMFPKLNGFFPLTVTMQAELGVMGALFIMGSAIQWRLLEVIHKKVKHLKQLDAERRMVEDAAAYRQTMALETDLAEWEKRHGSQAGRSPLGGGSGSEKGYESGGDAMSGKTGSFLSLLRRGQKPAAATPVEGQPVLPDTPTTLGAELELGYPPKAATLVRTDSGPAYVPVLRQSTDGQADVAARQRTISGHTVLPLKGIDDREGDGSLGLGGDLGGPSATVNAVGAEPMIKDDGSAEVLELKEKIKTLDEVREMRASIEKMRAELGSIRSNSRSATRSVSDGATRPSSSYSFGDRPRLVSSESRPASVALPNSSGPTTPNALTSPTGTAPPQNNAPLRPGTGGPKIDFEQYKNDRTLFRPPGAPTTYTSSGLTPTGELPPVVERQRSLSGNLDYATAAATRSRTHSGGLAKRASLGPEQMMSPPLPRPQSAVLNSDSRRSSSARMSGYFDGAAVARAARSPPVIPEEGGGKESGSRRQSRALLDLAEPSDAQGRPLPLEDQQRLREENARRVSMQPERLITAPIAPPRGMPAPSAPLKDVKKRESMTMSIDELDARHKERMRQLQQPVTQMAKDEAEAQKVKQRYERQEAARIAKAKAEEEKVKAQQAADRRKSRNSLAGLTLPSFATSNQLSNSASGSALATVGGPDPREAKPAAAASAQDRRNSLGNQLHRASMAQFPPVAMARQSSAGLPQPFDARERRRSTMQDLSGVAAAGSTSRRASRIPSSASAGVVPSPTGTTFPTSATTGTIPAPASLSKKPKASDWLDY